MKYISLENDITQVSENGLNVALLQAARFLLLAR